MWNTIEANEQYFSGWSLVKRTKILRSGLEYTSGTTQTGVHLIFAKLPKRLERGEHGTYQTEPAEALLPISEEYTVLLSQNSYLISGSTLYRIMSYDEFTQPWMEVYGLQLQRVEDYVD